MNDHYALGFVLYAIRSIGLILLKIRFEEAAQIFFEIPESIRHHTGFHIDVTFSCSLPFSGYGRKTNKTMDEPIYQRGFEFYESTPFILYTFSIADPDVI